MNTASQHSEPSLMPANAGHVFTTSPLMAGSPFHEAEAEEGEIPPEQIARWKVMGLIVFALLLVVVYQYQTKISAPMERMQPSVESELVTAPTTAEEALQTPDEDVQADARAPVMPADTQ